jgi:hypothetical protein
MSSYYDVLVTNFLILYFHNVRFKTMFQDDSNNVNSHFVTGALYMNYTCVCAKKSVDYFV